MRGHLFHFLLKPRSAPLTVLSLPHYIGSNPYLEQLNEALEQQGTRFLVWPRQVRLSHLRSLIANRKIPDILHQQWIHMDTLRPTLARSLLATAMFFVQLRMLRLLGVKIVWTLHNKMNHDGLFPHLDRWVRRAMFRIAHAVIVHSEAAAVEVSHHFILSKRARGKLHIVPHASYVGSYSETVSRGEARASFGLSESHFCYGFIGRLQSYKGIKELIEVFWQMPGHQLRLLVAGQVNSPTLRRWLDKQCAADPRIVLVPEHIPQNQLQTYFLAADVLVYPFRDQLTSGSVWTAASFGRGLVLPDDPSVSAGLPPEGRVLFQSGDRTSLSEALQRVSTYDTGAMGAANRRAMESPEMSWMTMGRRTIETYRAVLA